MDAIPYKRLVLTLAVYAGLTAVSFAQPPGGRGGPPRDRGPQRGGGSPGMLLRSDEVRAELELLDDQVEQLREIEEEMRDKMRQQFAGRQGGRAQRGGERGGGERGAGRPDGERGGRGEPRGERGERGGRGEPRGERGEGRPRGERGERGDRGGPPNGMRAVMEEMESRIAEVLTPQQMDRLKQIHTQQQLGRDGARVLMDGPLAESLNLSDEQKETLRERAQELRGEMEKKIEAARAEANEQLMAVLTSEQRAKLDAMTGEPFTMTRRQGPPGEGGRRGGRGRAGGGPQRGGGRPGPPPGDEL